jgi:hypothetical protein
MPLAIYGSFGAGDLTAAALPALARMFLLHEAIALERHRSRFVHVRARGIELPLSAAEALALQNPGPLATAQTLWRIQPPPEAMPDVPVAIEGIVALWPWPNREPADIAPLMALRQRLGRDPLPPSPV